MNTNESRPSAREVAGGDFQGEVLDSEQPVLVGFLAPWSQPCQVMDSVLNDIAAAWLGKAKVFKVNVDESLELDVWYDIQSIPTLLYFTDGKPRVRIIGTASKEAIFAKLDACNAAGSAGTTPEAS